MKPLKTALFLSLMISFSAFATGHKPPQHGGDSTAIALAEGGAGGRGGNASADSDASAVANTNVSTDSSASAFQGQTAVSDQNQSQSANNEGNSLSVNSQYREVRQAPAIGQGSIMVAGCGVGGNAGASSTGGAGFLGFAFTPAECYTFFLAQAYQNVGETVAACEALNTTRAAKRAQKRGMALPSCTPVVVAPVVIDTSDFVRRDELIERDDRIMKGVLGK